MFSAVSRLVPVRPQWSAMVRSGPHVPAHAGHPYNSWCCVPTLKCLVYRPVTRSPSWRPVRTGSRLVRNRPRLFLYEVACNFNAQSRSISRELSRVVYYLPRIKLESRPRRHRRPHARRHPVKSHAFQSYGCKAESASTQRAGGPSRAAVLREPGAASCRRRVHGRPQPAAARDGRARAALP